MTRDAAADDVTGQRADRRALAEVVDLIDDGVYDAASVLAWEVQRSAPGDPAVWLLLGRIDHLRERYAAAMYAARMSTRLDPSAPEAWIVLAQTAVQRERWWTEGLDAALQATALDPDSARPWTALARLQLAAGQRYDAAVSAERAVRVDAGYRGAHVVLGQVALETREWRHAVAAFRQALELDGSDRRARLGLATALEAQDIDPADELARFGSPVELRRRPSRRALTSARDRLDDIRSQPGIARHRIVLLAVSGCLAVGAVVGAVVPSLGPVRGLVGAIAVLLMWFAVRPVRLRSAPEPDVADVGAPVHPQAAGLPGAAAEIAAGEVGVVADEQVGHDARDGDDAAGEAVGEASAGDDAAGEAVGEASAGDDAAGEAVGEASAGDDAAGEAVGEASDGDDAASEAVADTRDGAPPADGPTAPAEPPQAAAPHDGRREPTADAAHDEPEDSAMMEQEPRDGGPAGTHPADGTDPSPPPRDTSDADIELPDDPDELIELSRRRLAVSDLDVAYAAAARVAAMAPESVDAHRALGAVALARHDYPQARRHYTTVLELEPLDQEARERLAMIGDERPPGRLRRFRGWR